NLKEFEAFDQAAKKAGVSVGSLSAMKTIVDSGDKEVLQSVIDGSRTLHAAVRLVRSEKPALRPRPVHTGTARLLDGDCRSEMKKIEDNTVDLVLTDPPYPCIGKNY